MASPFLINDMRMVSFVGDAPPKLILNHGPNASTSWSQKPPLHLPHLTSHTPRLTLLFYKTLLFFLLPHNLTHFTLYHPFVTFTVTMASSSSLVLQLFFFVSLLHFSFAARTLSQSSQVFKFQYHKGPLLTGKISVHLIWYGKFTPSQRAIVSDFIASLSSSTPTASQPSVTTWWKTLQTLYNPKVSLSLASQVLDDTYSMGKSLTNPQIAKLASKGGQKDAINVVLTAADVAVEGFCSSRCGTHGTSVGSALLGKRHKFAYIWVGNSQTQCPGQCAWPFHQPIYGPQNPPLVAPNNDVGLDGMVINVASMLAGTVTNPFGNGFFQGPKEAPLEAASACTGVYGKGAYPGYAGNLLVDTVTGASFNANGLNSRKYLLPALYDPTTSSCSTLV